MPDCALAANACAAACTLLVLGVALTCCVRWPFGFGGSDLSVTGERFSCYGRAFFLLREADFSVGRIDFSISRKCFSAFAQVHLSPLTSVFVYSCKCFYVFLQVFFCAPTSASRSLHEQLACMQAGLLPRPTLPCCGTVWWSCQVLKKRYRNLYVRISIPLIERSPYRLHDATTCVFVIVVLKQYVFCIHPCPNP